MHCRPNITLTQINHQIRLLRILIRVVHTRETLNLASARLGINTTLIRLLGVLQGSSNMNQVKAAVLLNRLSRGLAVLLKRRNGGNDGRGTGLGEF
jgi:hypothetical protein